MQEHISPDPHLQPHLPPENCKTSSSFPGEGEHSLESINFQAYALKPHCSWQSNKATRFSKALSLYFHLVSVSNNTELLSVFLYIPLIAPIPEKAMAPHSSTLVCKIPWTEEPGRLLSMGSLGVGHD